MSGKEKILWLFFALLLLPSEAMAARNRDERMTLRSSWDYQPGQGPYQTRPQESFRSGILAQPKPVYIQPLVTKEKEEMKKPEKRPAFSSFKTKSSFDLGAQVSSYGYYENTPPKMRVTGVLFGLTGGYTGALGNDWVARVDARLTAGRPYYKGSGQDDSVPNYSGEIRVVGGREFVRETYAILPYIGIGYRTLLNDLRMIESANVWGYQRVSQYLFLPIGVQPRMLLSNGSVLRLTMEFDPLLQGWQDSKFSGGNSAWPDIQNEQKGGYGLRGEMNYETERWSFGPFVNYWNVNKSTRDCATGSGYYVCAYEPHNHTLEYGVGFRYRFDQE